MDTFEAWPEWLQVLCVIATMIVLTAIIETWTYFSVKRIMRRYKAKLASRDKEAST